MSYAADTQTIGAWYPSPWRRLLHLVYINSWRSRPTILSLPKKFTPSTAILEWCHVHFICDSYTTFIRRVIVPSKNSIELFFNAKFDFKSLSNRDWATYLSPYVSGLAVPCGGQGEINLGGVKVTRFPFGPLNDFVYISHGPARINYQNRPHFEGDYRNLWLTPALLYVIQLAASLRNMMTNLCKIGT